MTRFHASAFVDKVSSEINQGNLSATLIQCRIFVSQMQKLYTAVRKCRTSCFEECSCNAKPTAKFICLTSSFPCAGIIYGSSSRA
jgi:hypothetical protein